MTRRRSVRNSTRSTRPRSRASTRAIEETQTLHRPGRAELHRRLAATLIDIEPRLRSLLGYRHLPWPRTAIQQELGITHPRPHHSQRSLSAGEETVPLVVEGP